MGRDFLAQTAGGFGIGGTLSVLAGLRQNDPVDLASALDRDETVRSIASYPSGISFRRSAETPSARQAQDDPLVGSIRCCRFGCRSVPPEVRTVPVAPGEPPHIPCAEHLVRSYMADRVQGELLRTPISIS